MISLLGNVQNLLKVSIREQHPNVYQVRLVFMEVVKKLHNCSHTGKFTEMISEKSSSVIEIDGKLIRSQPFFFYSRKRIICLFLQLIRTRRTWHPMACKFKKPLKNKKKLKVIASKASKYALSSVVHELRSEILEPQNFRLFDSSTMTPTIMPDENLGKMKSRHHQSNFVDEKTPRKLRKSSN